MCMRIYINRMRMLVRIHPYACAKIYIFFIFYEYFLVIFIIFLIKLIYFEKYLKFFYQKKYDKIKTKKFS